MAGLTTVLSVVNTTLTTLNKPLLKETFLTSVYGDSLGKLEGSLRTVKSMLLDAANNDELSETVRDYINKLKDVVYDADDFIDELITRAERMKLSDDDNLSEKVRQFFSSNETFLKVRELSLKLNDIAEEYARFGPGISTIPHRIVKPTETFSNGRENDASKVIGMLLDSRACVYYLAIVGIGGVGKTTLAKLVFDDKRVKDEFPIRLWVCVSDQDGAMLQVKQVLLKILELFDIEFYDSSSLEYLQLEYKRRIGKKFLLVLDDIRSENIMELRNLKELLMIQGSVSRIIATTRSKETARMMGNDTYQLEGLPEEHSKRLFEVAAFGDGDKPPHRRLRVDNFSNVYAPHVVGRDDDANKVIGMLLDSEMHVYFLAIVGIGGVGKTTLAKLVFGDERITKEFPIRMWVCVSDQDGTSLDEKQILLSILESLKCPFNNSSSLDSLRREYQRNLQGKQFLLVLDDIWNEKIIELDKLKELLMIGGSKSRIIVTTRSQKTARIIGNDTLPLEGLSEEHSQHLFEMEAFRDGKKPPELVEIGEKIVKKSSHVPLSIMVIGRLLHGQPIDKWRTFETSGFNTFPKGMNDILSVSKSSYDNLDPSLKSCFAYCAIFPKDFVIRKEMIINLWDAQGYIVPFYKSQSIEDVGEEYFSVLLQRCFFQDVKKNELGDVESFKIHDLMHEIAQRVSGNDICVINSSMPLPEYSVRHIYSGNSISKPIDGSIVFKTTNKSKIRTYLMLPNPNSQDGVGDELLTFEIPKNWGYLRALVLQNPNIRIPDTIGNLLHLRYLSLSHSRMKNLPDSIVKLYNLKTLDISYCEYLNEWPKEFSKLVNLTNLYWEFCWELKCMPVGMSKFSHLSRLTEFVVADESASGMQRVGQLKDLKALAMNLKGRIHIIFIDNFKSADGYDWEGSCLEDAQHLNEVIINFHCPPHSLDYVAPLQNKERGGKEEVVMEKMKPNPNLKSFMLTSYSGEKIARWGRAQDNWGSFLPNLVVIDVEYCERLQELPVLSKLRHLKHLFLIGLKNLEYMEEEVTDSIGLEFSGSRSLDTTFFPSLEYLHLDTLENLKGWWRSGDSNESHRQPAFPNLSYLAIYDCPRLVSFPPCLSLPKLKLGGNSKRLRIRTANGEHASSS